tara:strand:- start:4861 stop:5286 length:426 start_codon:yes stop_codon:yes gene_type:complete
MSITPVGAVGSESSQITSVKQAQKPASTTSENLPPNPLQDFSDSNAQKAGASAAAPTPYAPSKISTEGFVDLRGGDNSDKGDFKVLDKVIEKIHKNIEELGDLIENMAKLAEKTNKQAVGMQIMEKTFEAIDEIQGEDSKK